MAITRNPFSRAKEKTKNIFQSMKQSFKWESEDSPRYFSVSKPVGWSRTPDYLQTETPPQNCNKCPAQTLKTCNVLGVQLQLQPRLPTNLGHIKHSTACLTCRHHHWQPRLRLEHRTHKGSVVDTVTFQPCSSRAVKGVSFSLIDQDDKQQTAPFFQVESTSSSHLSREFCCCLRHKRTKDKKAEIPKEKSSSPASHKKVKITPPQKLKVYSFLGDEA